MVKSEESVLWRNCHVVGSVPPEHDVLHGVEVWPIEGGLKMLVHEVENLVDDWIGHGMSFSVLTICVDDEWVVCEGYGEWTPGACHGVWTETGDGGSETCVHGNGCGGC